MADITVNSGRFDCNTQGVRSIWVRHGRETFKKRLRALEARMAQENFILTEEQLRAFEKAKKKVYTGLEELQKDLDKWIFEYNTERTHSGKYCYGKTPMQTFLEGKHLAEEKMLDKLHEKVVVREVATVR